MKKNIFHFNDIKTFIDKMKKKYYSQNNFLNKKLILIFQEFDGKCVDFLAIIRMEKKLNGN